MHINVNISYYNRNGCFREKEIGHFYTSITYSIIDTEIDSFWKYCSWDILNLKDSTRGNFDILFK